MHFIVFISLGFSLMFFCCAETERSFNCNFTRKWLESIITSVELNKRGFHRELVTTFEFKPGFPDVLKLLLVHKLPNGVYIDPYQIASLKNSDLKVLLDSSIDLEAPAHKFVGFTAFVYTSLGRGNLKISISIPLHGRYHKPSLEGKMIELVNIEHPRLLLRTDTCAQPRNFQPTVVLPCTSDNSSLCQWCENHFNEELSRLHFEIPLGDESMMTAVCAGTFVVTLVCCALLSRNIWEHKIL